MKVLHISTYDSGGAGLSAIKTHLALLEAGVKSQFLCLYKSSTSIPEVYQFQKPTNRAILRILNRFGLMLPNSILNQHKILGKKGEFEIFSFPTTDFQLHNHELIKEADIIHLHWVSNFIDYPSFFTNIKKPIVWTLHDMNPFQGGFHYLDDKENNNFSWSKIEDELLNIKKVSINQIPTLHVVTPSKWLGEAAKKSDVFRGRPVHDSFYYGIDFKIFKPLKKEIACEVLGIPFEGIKLFFIADSLLNKRKGFDLLINALLPLKDKYNISLVTVGSSNSKPLQDTFKCHNLGTINDSRLLNVAYNIADCLVLPSREDNMPNVMLEALACGLPVVSFPVGGMAELIETGVNGILAKEVSSDSLTEALDLFIKIKHVFKPDEIRIKAKNTFESKIHAEKIMNVYNLINI